MKRLYKYPRTHHLEGSRLQPGDADLDSILFTEIKGRFLVIEEKLDGANAGICFDDKQNLHLQSRGHFLTGGGREKHFNLFKRWGHAHTSSLWKILTDRFVLYGEWLYAKHTIFYDRLPHYFLEFDILDTKTGQFLSTERRRRLLADSPVASVPVLREGEFASLRTVTALLNNSLFKSNDWRSNLTQAAEAKGLDVNRIHSETDSSDLMEGLYVKVEEKGSVVARYKFIRADFLTAVLDSGTHWLKRPILPNQLQKRTDIFEMPP